MTNPATLVIHQSVTGLWGDDLYQVDAVLRIRLRGPRSRV